MTYLQLPPAVSSWLFLGFGAALFYLKLHPSPIKNRDAIFLAWCLFFSTLFLMVPFAIVRSWNAGSEQSVGTYRVVEIWDEAVSWTVMACGILALYKGLTPETGKPERSAEAERRRRGKSDSGSRAALHEASSAAKTEATHSDEPRSASSARRFSVEAAADVPDPVLEARVEDELASEPELVLDKNDEIPLDPPAVPAAPAPAPPAAAPAPVQVPVASRPSASGVRSPVSGLRPSASGIRAPLGEAESGKVRTQSAASNSRIRVDGAERPLTERRLRAAHPSGSGKRSGVGIPALIPAATPTPAVAAVAPAPTPVSSSVSGSTAPIIQSPPSGSGGGAPSGSGAPGPAALPPGVLPAPEPTSVPVAPSPSASGRRPAASGIRQAAQSGTQIAVSETASADTPSKDQYLE